MHNRKKLERPPTDAEIAALQKKTQTYASLVSIIFERRRTGDKSVDTLSLVGKMLRNNPDFYTLWNFRREILFDMHSGLEQCSSDNKYAGDNADQIRDDEMSLSADGIVKNPKSYGAWHHRQWIISKFDVNFQHELSLCKEFLRQDQRNFHCWNYRRFVVSIAGVDPADELQYAQEKIQENFSNYSAFHHRSNFIKKNSPSIMEVLPSEFSIVENAIFTEPDDQSAWWYHQFLLTWATYEIGQLKDAGKGAEADTLAYWFSDILRQQLELVRGLYELEEGCTWVMNCMVAIMDLILVTPVRPEQEPEQMIGLSSLRAERCELLEKLVTVDPNHQQRYKYLLLNVANA